MVRIFRLVTSFFGKILSLDIGTAVSSWQLRHIMITFICKWGYHIFMNNNQLTLFQLVLFYLAPWLSRQNRCASEDPRVPGSIHGAIHFFKINFIFFSIFAFLVCVTATPSLSDWSTCTLIESCNSIHFNFQYAATFRKRCATYMQQRLENVVQRKCSHV